MKRLKLGWMRCCCYTIVAIVAFTVLMPSLALSQSKSAAWTSYKSTNGMDVILLPDSKVPLATIVLVAKAGARTETKDINGLTHLWEHMFFKGNARLPDQEAFNKRVRELGIVFNGDTSAEIVRYYFTLPSANLNDGLQFMADAISTPQLDKVELERERKVVLDEYDRSASQPGFELNNIERMLIYGENEHQRNPLGRRGIIASATREQLLRIKSEVFVPANCALIIAGDVDEGQIKAKIAEIFSGWTTPQNWKALPEPQFARQWKPTEVVMRHPTAQNATLQMTFDGPRALTEEKDTFVADALINLLSQRSGKFYKKYMDSGVTLQSGLGYHTQGHSGEIVLYAVAPAANIRKAQSLLLKEPFEWAKPGYFTREQMMDARRQMIVHHKFELNRPSEYAKTLAFWWGTAGLSYLSQYIESVEKVSERDIQEFVKKYLINKSAVTTLLVNEKDAAAHKIEDNSSAFRDRFLKNY
jgi:zinc protease